MLRKITVLLLAAAMMLSLCACGGETPPAQSPVQSSAPGRMVQRIDVAIHPADPDYERTYVTLENMNALLGLLREMETQDYPETTPDPAGGQTLYTATVTYSNGEQSVYRLLGHMYLQLGDDPWCIVGTERSMEFIHFLLEHPSDDGSAPIETTAPPAETTAPTE